MSSFNPRIDVSVIIVNWNTRDLLGRCLTSLEQNINGLADTQIETIVIDNASSDDSVQLVKNDYPWAILIENESNVGFAAANNQGLRRVKGDNILYLNSDTELMPGAIGVLLDALDRYPLAGAIGPNVLDSDGTIQNSYGKLPNLFDEIVGPYLFDFFTKPWGKFSRYRRRSLTSCKNVDRVSFACTMTRMAAQQDVGEFDERFVFYSEDYDWFIRLHKAGWSVMFCPRAHVKHHWGASSRKRREWANEQLFRSKRLYFSKHYGSKSEQLLRIGFSLRFFLKILLASLIYPLKPAWSRDQVRRNNQLIQNMITDLDPR